MIEAPQYAPPTSYCFPQTSIWVTPILNFILLILYSLIFSIPMLYKMISYPCTPATFFFPLNIMLLRFIQVDGFCSWSVILFNC